MNIAATLERPLSNCVFDISSLHASYVSGADPRTMVDEVFARIEEASDPAIFISLRDKLQIYSDVDALGTFDIASKPLWGIPFAIKDNIDAADMSTTAACPAFAYVADRDAYCVERLREAGAILIGKTNLDQFATGLVGVRSPYGAPLNPIDPTLVPGGSSSGSAVAVSRALVTFALGTDTAGSGRVPAALNNIVGLKPTLGILSGRGVVPACRTLDTVSIFALTVPDAFCAFRAAAGLDAEDPYSRDISVGRFSALPPAFEVVVPDDGTREFFGDEAQLRSFDATLNALAELGARLRKVDFSPFFEVAKLLYDGPWVAERYTVVREFLKGHEDEMHPVVAGIIKCAEGFSAADAFSARYRLDILRKDILPTITAAFAVCVPTVPAYCTLADIESEPVAANSRLGIYTNFVNLLDMCGIAAPVAARDDGLPGSVTILSAAGNDARLASLAARLHGLLCNRLGATQYPVPSFHPDAPSVDASEIEIGVVGAHMSGLPLNRELTDRGARFLRQARTKADYRFYALAGGPPARPGMVRTPDGSSIELEIWAMPKENFGDFMQGIPAPLCIGSIVLEDGAFVKGFLCEESGLEGAREITAFGGWRKFLASAQS
jgi:allophanate hydrolase